MNLIKWSVSSNNLIKQCGFINLIKYSFRETNPIAETLPISKNVIESVSWVRFENKSTSRLPIWFIAFYEMKNIFFLTFPSEGFKTLYVMASLKSKPIITGNLSSISNCLEKWLFCITDRLRISAYVKRPKTHTMCEDKTLWHWYCILWSNGNNLQVNPTGKIQKFLLRYYELVKLSSFISKWISNCSTHLLC